MIDLIRITGYVLSNKYNVHVVVNLDVVIVTFAERSNECSRPDLTKSFSEALLMRSTNSGDGSIGTSFPRVFSNECDTDSVNRLYRLYTIYMYV